MSRLIGAPPGYVGYEEGGVLTESIRRRPYQLLLLDEFEKCHHDVWNILLQLFDEGHLTDSHGRKVDFRNVLVVMTSNIGADVLSDLPSHYKGNESEVESVIMDSVQKTLSPELLNRIDDTILFNRLQRENMNQITDIGLNEIGMRLETNQNMTLDVTQAAKECLSERGYDVRYGARPLQRLLTKSILNPLSHLVLDGGVRDGEIVQVRTQGEADILARNGDANHGWLGVDKNDDKNNVVILRNHPKQASVEKEQWDDEEFLFEDGIHGHR